MDPSEPSSSKPLGFICRYCDKSFSFATNRSRHEKKHDIKKESSTKLQCKVCSNVFNSKVMLTKHFTESHSEMKGTEKVKFSTLNEFKVWKEQTENVSSSSFVVSKTYETNGARVHVYSCHRSGYFKSRSKGLRHIKTKGSNKIGSICPAYMKVYVDKNTNEVTVLYFSTHMNHDAEIGRLRLSVLEKEKIADQLHAGVPITSIMNEIAATASPSKRLAITSTQDIRNISVTYGMDIRTVRCQEDVSSVDNWVQEVVTRDEGYNPILLYKLPGKRCAHFPSLEKEDFILGFMNDSQRDIFKIYGNEIVSIDSTHGTNKYDVQLTSLIVKDDNWEGFPVAFLWSNRQHEEVFRYFFEVCKERIGELQVNTFMSNDDPAFYSAWKTIFGEAHFHLICQWHVKRAWYNSLASGEYMIKNPGKRAEAQGLLDSLISELDEPTFLKLLTIVKSKLLKDPETSLFGKYLTNKYFGRTKQWAACYRIGAHINTNMGIERWHLDLKYNSDLKGQCGGCLDKAISSLIKSLRMKLMNRLSSLHRGKLTKKIIAIRQTHRNAEEIKSEMTILKEGENSWIMYSEKQFGETYKIKRWEVETNHKCNLVCEACQICLHAITCSCSINSIRFNMCNHIHVLCLKENSCVVNSHYENSRPYEKEEKEVIFSSLDNYKSSKQQNLKKDALEAAMGLIKDIEEFTNDEQYREVLKLITIARNKCKSIVLGEHKLLLVASKNSVLKKMQPRRIFSKEKKNSKRKGIVKKNDPSTILQVLLSEDPVASSGATSASMLDYQ